MSNYTGKQLKLMTSMEFTKAIEVIPLEYQLRLAISKIDFNTDDFNEIADILNKFNELEIKKN